MKTVTDNESEMFRELFGECPGWYWAATGAGKHCRGNGSLMDKTTLDVLGEDQGPATPVCLECWKAWLEKQHAMASKRRVSDQAVIPGRQNTAESGRGTLRMVDISLTESWLSSILEAL